MRFLLCSAILLLSSHIAPAAEPIVVRNSDKPLWDNTHRIEFAENLRIGGEGDEDEVLGQVIAIATDSKGRIIAADRADNAVRRYNREGAFIGVVGRGGEGPGEYQQLFALTTDTKDNIYVACQGRVCIFDSDGKYLRQLTDESHDLVHSIRVLKDGSILLSEFDPPTGKTLQKYIDDKVALRFGEAHEFPEGFTQGIVGLQGGHVDIGRDGMIYYTQQVPYEICKFTPAGELVMRVHRENDFVKPPRVERGKDWMKVYSYCGSAGILALDDGKLINVIAVPAEEDRSGQTILDLFDGDGHLLLTQRSESPFNPQWRDAAGDVYAFDRDAGAIIRAHMTIH